MKYKLVAFDVDGTLISEQVWKRLHTHFGMEDDFNEKNITLYRQGKLTYSDWVKSDIDIWKKKGATKSLIKEGLKDVKLVDGAKELIQELKKMGYKLAIISGSLNVAIEHVFPDYEDYFDYIFLNKILFDDEGNIVDVESTKFDHEGKAAALAHIAKLEGLSLQECVFVGDNYNDVDIAKIAGLSIAFNCRDKNLAEVCDVIVNSNDMRNLLDYIHEA
ncbi:HAD family hydrolase [Candidatus Woesearchaeota archaeon]|nr:MAG: HAD family hydrolase [Candidatus Woesearchaeota archaeon]